VLFNFVRSHCGDFVQSTSDNNCNKKHCLDDWLNEKYTVKDFVEIAAQNVNL